MKNIKYFTLGILSLFISCNNAEYEILDNAVYISAAASSSEKAETITMNNGATIQLLVRLAKAVEEDVEVEVVLDQSLLTPYNEMAGTEYLPITNLTLPAGAKVVIPAGEISAAYTIQVEDFDTGSDRYAVGVSLGKVLKGNVPVSTSQASYLYILAKPLNVSVPEMTGPNAVIAAPSTNWGINVNQWTIECWAKMSAYSINNQAIFYTGSNDHEIYIRFGDANRPYNYLQIKTLGGQVQTASDLVANRWYHWAFVYDGTTLSIYRDGEADVKFNPPAPLGGSVRIDFLQMIASGTYFRDRAQMGEVRLWNTAISQTQIKNNMYFSINPKNPNLIGYWPMNEGTGNTFNDITGNGHNATAGANVIRSWIPNVNFRNL
ncbi:DUF1735 and LamG domain-containing protein [Sphingobacterium hungaricum]|uniref:BT-3987-like N-terminal domain-containing protein n=1 Tax=Sphingobacterium hungaricum TaxID=2082723 RepID=A0A928YR69_9SPHI|nr:DUF1735 and LamG domain-containing protein [Sphingobacterium hungaricum]MBE8715001.1 hypothetical protein [Sphingobacterium hungaricum]